MATPAALTFCHSNLGKLGMSTDSSAGSQDFAFFVGIGNLGNYHDQMYVCMDYQKIIIYFQKNTGYLHCSKQHYINYGVYTIGIRAKCSERDGLTSDLVTYQKFRVLGSPYS